jgi:nicotinate-nucleotide adenylyltransferase
VVFARPGTPIPPSPLIDGTVAVPAVEISATEIRRRVREGRPVRYWVPDAVAEYMVRHRLYLDPE